jgi:membrane protein implicated in regulation of membrane protease activity
VVPLSVFGYDLLGLIGLIILALVIVFVIRVILILIPAAIVAFVVWFISNGNLWLTGVAFLVVAALSILKKL